MSKREFIARYGLIINKLRRGPVSFDELDFFLQNQSSVDGYNYSISQRTFQRDIKDIEHIHKIFIKYDHANKVYYIANEEDDKLGQRMLEAFDLFNAFNTPERISQHIHFESRRPQGTDNLHGILHGIKNGFEVAFTYTKYWDDKVSERTVQPYALKEFKNRWYLVCNDLKDNRIKTFGLDRLTDLEITRKGFEIPTSFDVGEHFKYCFGIISPNAQKPEEVVLSFTVFQGKYIKSLPLQHTQQVLIDNEEELRIKLKVFITEDFVMEIISHGERVKVLEPKSFANEIRSIHEAAAERYL
ncbi:MAG: WYL domain-containing protein [Bacteroidales bacterium]|nr:WYL domain-containing protein [Bacteroidales bacterium]